MDEKNNFNHLVSIGMPVFNDKEYISESLDSLLSQSFKDFELIISDDNSLDGSEEICVQYAQKDPRIKYFKQQSNLGIQQNMEFVLDQASGKFFMWAADDDLWANNFIEKLVIELEKNEDVVLSFCPYVFVDEKSQIIKERKIKKSNYAGFHYLIRLMKFCLFYDDGCGYGLLRREKILSLKYPVWKGINMNVSGNIIFPPIFFILTKGNFLLIDSEPLFYKRLKKQKNYLPNYIGNPISEQTAYLQRKKEVMVESLKNVHKANKSFLGIIAIFPFILLRFIYDVIKSIIPFFKKIFYYKKSNNLAN